MRSPTLLLIRMNAAETSASSAIADCTPLAVVSRSLTTAEIDTFISDVSTTSTNIAIASSSDRRGLATPSSGALVAASLVTGPRRSYGTFRPSGQRPADGGREPPSAGGAQRPRRVRGPNPTGMRVVLPAKSRAAA